MTTPEGLAAERRWRTGTSRLSGTVLLVLLLSGCASAGPPTSSGAAAGERAPTFTASTLEGGRFVSAERFASEPTVLWFWAPWCTICRTEAGEVAALAEEFDGEVALVGVAGRGEVTEMESFVSDTGTDGFEHVVDSDGSIWSDFGVVAQPAFAFVDRSGRVEVFNGALPPDQLRASMRLLAEG